MGRLRQLARLLAIQRTLMRHGLDDFVWATHLFRPVGWLRRLLPKRSRHAPLGARIRMALEELGPIFVKFGQAVSTRRDLLPADIADELAKLQDQVPPFATSEVLEILAEAFGRPADDVFQEFQRAPLAAASVAQVHVARLHDGREVVVKVLRPGVHKSVRKDLAVLYAIAELAERYWPDARRLRPREVVQEFEATLFKELDLMREAANAAQLRRNFEGSATLYVPDVYWNYCRSNVLTMERIAGVPISDLEELQSRGTNIRRLAENGVEIFFNQVFTHNFFHADMHPGNIFVDVTDPEQPRYIAVDFGIVGTLSPRDQHYLAANFLAFFKRDYYRVARLHVDSGWVPPNTRVTELEAAIPRGLRAHLQQAAEGHLVRAGAAAPVSDGAPVRHAGAAPTGTVAEDAPEHRGPWTPALSGAGPVGYRQAGAGEVDGPAHRPAHASSAVAGGLAARGGGSAVGARGTPAGAAPCRRKRRSVG